MEYKKKEMNKNCDPQLSLKEINKEMEYERDELRDGIQEERDE
jgi:hypothetical protein